MRKNPKCGGGRLKKRTQKSFNFNLGVYEAQEGS